MFNLFKKKIDVRGLIQPMMYTEGKKETTICSKCGGKYTGNCCGDRIVYWCNKCGYNGD